MLFSAVDTICAVATPLGTSGIGVIRLSGPDALDIASKIFSTNIKQAPSHTLHHGNVIDPQNGSVIDDAVAAIFKNPKSYTGEDVVEFSCHGSLPVLKDILNLLLNSGARLAEPGEFTKRAFFNGKLDLSQAEAVNDLIRAGSDKAREIAVRQLKGSLSKIIKAASHQILGIIAAVEAAVDFPDDVDEPDSTWLISEISKVIEILDGLISSAHKGRIYREGLRIVIAGHVNVGKSSLLNALLRHSRAIVTPIPGTTRDVIEENLEICGIPVIAIDTAGIRDTIDPVEIIGVERSWESVETADIILLVLDINEGLTKSDLKVFDAVSNSKPVILVLNKIDKLSIHEQEEAKQQITQEISHPITAVLTSAFTGDGIEDLENMIAAVSGDVGELESVTVSNVRHIQALTEASKSLKQALFTLELNQPIDLLNVDLTSARYNLGLITGESAAEDLLERIFAEFCIGK